MPTKTTKAVSKAAKSPSKKAPAKKAVVKKETITEATGVFIATSKTVKLTIKGQSYSRKATKEEWETIRPSLELYNKSSDSSKAKSKLEDKLIKFMTPVAVKTKKEKEKLTTTAKAVSRKINKTDDSGIVNTEQKDFVKELSEKLASGDISDSELEELEKLIAKNKKVEVKAPAPYVASTSRRGEY